MSILTVGSLFSGIGGIDLGLERTHGFKVVWQVEIDPYCQKVLAKHWPHVARYGDIRTVGKHNLSPVDLLCGGFPCQPHSLAGKRQAGKDERDLWGEFYRIICDLRPPWVLAENVPGLLSSENGRFFGRILRDLAQARYDAEWQCLRASDVGAPHLRERIFIVAYPTSKQIKRLQQRQLQPHLNANAHVVNASRQRLQRLWTQKIQRVEAFSWCQDIRSIEDLRDRTDLPQSIIRRDSDGFSYGVDRLRGLGNAVVPQCAEYVGRCILDALRTEVSA